MEKKYLEISSRAFPENGAIPVKYSSKGANVNPPLYIRNVPEGAVSLAIIMRDADAPIGPWVHWLVWNIPVGHRIRENYKLVIQGMNDFGRISYTGPCPPKGVHRYYFMVYALDCMLGLTPGAGRRDLEQAMNGHIMAYGALMGLYPVPELPSHDLIKPDEKKYNNAL